MNTNTQQTTGFTARDYYETLGVPRTATGEEIDNAYKKLSLRHHPDQYKGTGQQQQADASFTHVSEAFQALSDPEKRRKYDEFLNSPQSAPQPQQQTQSQPPYHPYRHPHYHFYDLINYEPLSPFDFFDNNFNRGFFNNYDLELYDRANKMFNHFGRIEDEFFGSEDFNKFIKEGNKGSFHKSKTVSKHTRIDNGKRVTITDVKTVHPDGKTDREIKEVTADDKGNRQVRYLDELPQNLNQYMLEHTKPQIEGEKKPTGN